jgi:hypothetical protein
MADEPFWDELGRGPMVREFHRRCGYDPAEHAAGFASWARALERARKTGPEWPERFRGMLLAAVRSALDAERAAARQDVQACVHAEVDRRLALVRAAYSKLRSEVAELRSMVRPGA